MAWVAAKYVAVGVVVAALVACGGRSALESYPGNSSLGDGASGGTTSGSFGNPFGGSSGPDGGTFGTITAGTPAGGMAVGGMPVGGMPAGGMLVGGMPLGGMNVGQAGAGSEDCQLATTDCYTLAEPECAGVRMQCQGELLSHGLVWGTNRAHVNDLATAVDGRVAVAGDFLGLLNVDDATLPTVSTNDDGFVLVFDSERNLLWSHFFGGATSQAVTGVDFAPGGDVVVQGYGASDGGAFVTRLDQQGKTLWSYALGNADTTPGQIGVDNDGNITLVGGFQDELEYRGNVQGAVGYASYVVHLDADGTLIWGSTGTPPKWQRAAASKLVVDDEDNLVVVGNGRSADGVVASYVEKISSTGESVFLSELVASNRLAASALAIDRKMQIVVGGVFSGDLQLDDLSRSSQVALGDDLWLAKLGRDGAWQWLDTQAGKGGTSALTAIATDPAGNIVVGSSDHDQVLVSKRRESGLVVWDLSFPTSTPSNVRLASDNAGNMWLASNFTKSFDYGADVVKPQGNGAVILLELSR